MGGLALDETPLLPVLLAVAGIALATEIGLLRIAHGRFSRSRRLQPGEQAPTLVPFVPPAWRLLELGAWVPPGATALLTALSIQRSRGLILQVLEREPENAHRVATGMRGALSATVIGVVSLVPLLLLACWVAGIAAASRLAAERAEPAPASRSIVALASGFAAFAIVPVACAAAFGALGELNALAAASTLDPSAQEKLLAAAARATHGGLRFAFHIAVTGTLATAAAAWFWTRDNADSSVWLSTAALCSALALAALSLPMKRENESPWPTGATAGLELGFETPPVRGPDPLALGPLVELTRSSLRVDRVKVSIATLEASFRASRQQFDVLHPGEPFRGAWNLACAPDTPATRAFEALARIAQAGYRKPTWVFEVRETIVRPVLGPVPLHRVTGASTTVVAGHEHGGSGASEIGMPDAASCGALAERIAHARSQGAVAALRVSEPLEAATP